MKDILNIYIESIKTMNKTNQEVALGPYRHQLVLGTNGIQIQIQHPTQMNHNNHQDVEHNNQVGNQGLLLREILKDALLGGQ